MAQQDSGPVPIPVEEDTEMESDQEGEGSHISVAHGSQGPNADENVDVAPLEARSQDSGSE